MDQQDERARMDAPHSAAREVDGRRQPAGPDAEPSPGGPKAATRSSGANLSSLVRECAEPIHATGGTSLGGLLERAGDARLVLLGGSTHGTSEFYELRARITKELLTQRGFDFVAVVADWPDAARVHDYVVDAKSSSRVDFTPYARFPAWMWRNQEVRQFIAWLCAHNRTRPRAGRTRVGFHGLDLYSTFSSLSLMLAYLDSVHVEAAHVARARCGRSTPWLSAPALCEEAATAEGYLDAEPAVVAMLEDVLRRRLQCARKLGARFFAAAQSPRVVSGAEAYYRALYQQAACAWSLRDSHMFETLEALLSFYGPGSRGVVWAHNAHVGDASATELRARGALNIGQLCRSAYGDAAYLVGFATDRGRVAAASAWEGPMQSMRVRPARADSYERVLHDTRVPAFTLPLRAPRSVLLREALAETRLERAIGVVYRPELELQGHYLRASLAEQFDELVWYDETRAVTPLPRRAEADLGRSGTYRIFA